MTRPLEHIADRRPQTRKLSGMKPPPIPGVSGEKKARGSEEHAGWLMGYTLIQELSPSRYWSPAAGDA